MNETYVTILGNVVDEPVLRATSSGDPFVTFRLASTPRRRRPGSNEFVNADSNFYDVVAFRQLALHAGSSVRKSQPLMVYGQLRVQQWSSGGKRGTRVTVEATSIGHDLRRGIADFSKRMPFGLPPAPAEPASATGTGPRNGDVARGDVAREPAALQIARPEPDADSRPIAG